MTDYEKPTSMTIGDYCWRLGQDGRYVMQDGYAGSRYQCGVTESLLVERLAKAEQKARWIPVSERLPEEYELVMVGWAGRRDIGKGYLLDGKWHDPLVGQPDVNQPTHWQPLPEPPEVK